MWYNYNNIKGKKPNENLLGKRFGELTVKAYTRLERSKGLTGYWLCKCSCGIEIFIRGNKIHDAIGCQSCACSISARTKKGGKYLNIKHYSIKRRIYREYIKRARYKGYDFLLTEEEFFKLLKGNCYYCGIEPQIQQIKDTLSLRDGPFTRNGIDRINSNKGYILNNVVSCCTYCNNAKSNKTLEEFNNWIQRLIMFNK